MLGEPSTSYSPDTARRRLTELLEPEIKVCIDNDAAKRAAIAPKACLKAWRAIIALLVLLVYSPFLQHADSIFFLSASHRVCSLG